MTTERKRRKFTPKFKKDAVALVTEQGYSIAKAAQAVDTRENNLRHWKKELEQEASGERLNADERAELARLRREVKELRMEKEILKGSAFFARDQLMNKLGLVVKRKKRFVLTTDSKHALAVAENVLNRNFTPPEKNRVWTTDITYIWTMQGRVYLAVVIDRYSRRVVGWGLDRRMETALVTQHR